VIAVVPVRGGTLPIGADEVVAEAGGRVVVIGDGTAAAAAGLHTAALVRCAEVGPFAPAAWSVALAPVLAAEDMVVLPGTPDGRDLAPRLAAALARPFYGGALEVTPDRVVLSRLDGRVTETHVPEGPAVATLIPGVRGFLALEGPPEITSIDLALVPVPRADCEVLEVLPPDPATVDLAEATRIVAGGAGLGSIDAFGLLQRVAPALGASYGASRVAADAGWADPDRFIGTTGVLVTPELYVALGISGAVQHLTGIGEPRHVIAVNRDASAPMMRRADLAIVTDAPALLVELADRLGVARA
jgi:electron transfer flavoprotein alpha subunit